MRLLNNMDLIEMRPLEMTTRSLNSIRCNVNPGIGYNHTVKLANVFDVADLNVLFPFHFVRTKSFSQFGFETLGNDSFMISSTFYFDEVIVGEGIFSKRNRP